MTASGCFCSTSTVASPLPRCSDEQQVQFPQQLPLSSPAAALAFAVSITMAKGDLITRIMVLLDGPLLYGSLKCNLTLPAYFLKQIEVRVLKVGSEDSI